MWRIWQAFWQQPRAWCWFVVGVALLTGGFHYRILPASQIVTKFGTPVAALGVALGCFIALLAAAGCWTMLRPEEPAGKIVARTCLSLMVASMLCVWACIGPIGGTFYAHGRFIRLAIWIAGFLALQLAWLWKWDRHLKERLPQLWREQDPVSWPDAILAATCAVFVAEMATYFDRPYIQITPFALVMNIALLAAAMVVAWAILGRGLFAIGLTAIGYFTLSFANAMKLKHLYAGLQLGDQSYLGELFYFKEFFEPKPLAIGGLVVVALLACLVWAWRRSSRRLPWATRGRMLLGGVATLLLVAGLPWMPLFKPVLHHLGIIEETWDSYMSVKRNGLLAELAMQLPESYVPAPAGYDSQAIARVLALRTEPGAENPSVTVVPVGEPVSLIVFFFEALTNPHDFGRPLTREVTPNFNALQAAGPHGYAITPRFANGSAESEFELVTGMSTGFLPPNSCAYKHFMKRATPSLVTMLRQQAGYHSTAVKCVTPSFYNFQEAYEHLRFDRFCFDLEFVAPTYDKFSGHMSDDSFVAEMLRPLANPPCLVVGENLGSHAPYQPHLMGDKPRFLVEPSNPACDQIETYFQAIARTDDALGRMIEQLKQRTDRVVLLVVGDHHPPLANDSYAYDIPAFQTPGPAGELFRRRVPFAIWKNFEDAEVTLDATAETKEAAAGKPADETYISMNFLSLLLLREAGIQPTGLIAWDQTLFEKCPVISRDVFYSGGRAKSWDELSPEVQQLIHDYELLQYDIFLGENYAEQLWARPAVASDDASTAEKSSRLRVPLAGRIR